MMSKRNYKIKEENCLTNYLTKEQGEAIIERKLTEDSWKPITV